MLCCLMHSCVCVNRKKCEDDLKKKLMHDLHKLIEGKMKQVRCHHVFSHCNSQSEENTVAAQLVFKEKSCTDHQGGFLSSGFWNLPCVIDSAVFVKVSLRPPQMAYAHDSVRVLQCFIQFSSHEQRLQVYEELKGEKNSRQYSNIFSLTSFS